jgi:hypothetical protein
MKSLTTLLLIFLLYFSLSNCNNTQAGYSTAPQNEAKQGRQENPVKTTQELRKELADRETINPAAMLFANGSIRENKVLIQKPDFFHHSVYQTDGWIITGTIYNKASIAQFKDAIVKITFYTETQTALQSQEVVLYKYFTPRTSIPFEIKVYPPAEMKQFTIEVTNATALN